jgi:hypothetical protein
MKYLRSLIVKFIPRLWLLKVRLSFQNFDETPPIVIYQMGKVGSSAVYESLKKAGLANPVYQVHFLSYTNLDEVERYYQSVGANNDIVVARFWRLLRHKLDRTKVPLYLISLVREPVAREISDVFHNMANYHGELLTDTGDVNVDKTVDFLNAHFADFNEKSDYACTWFDKEILDVFGIDVYASPFDHTRGFSIIESGRVKLLLIRMEDLSRIFAEAMNEFMGFSVPLARSNESASKRYHNAYQAVLQKFALPTVAGKKIYDSRYAQHFYPAEVRSKLVTKWCSSNQDDPS